MTLTITGQTAIGCEFVVTGSNPVIVKNDGLPAKGFQQKVAEKIANQLRVGGDIVHIKNIES